MKSDVCHGKGETLTYSLYVSSAFDCTHSSSPNCPDVLLLTYSILRRIGIRLGAF